MYENETIDKPTATYFNMIMLCQQMKNLKPVTAKHLTNDKLESSLISNITNQYPKISSADMLLQVCQKLNSDTLFKDSYANFLLSKIDVAAGYKSGIKVLFRHAFEKEFLLNCFWWSTNNISLKETEIVKMIIGKQ